MNNTCRGLGVALATPFLPDGSLDLESLERLTKHVMSGGADFLVVLGSTGEAAMLSEIERDQVVTAVRETADSTPVFVGTGAAATAHTVAWTKRAQELGADGVLVVVPPYTKPTQLGLVTHYRAIAEAAPDLALIIYNVPSRTGTNLLPATLQSIWKLPNAVAIKESSGDLQQVGRIAAELPSGKLLLSGDDALALPTIAAGGQGLVSVAANVVPGRMRDLVAAARSGDFELARSLSTALQPLLNALCVEPNPIAIKVAIELLGLAGSMVRLPLLPGNAATRQGLKVAMAQQREVIHD